MSNADGLGELSARTRHDLVGILSTIRNAADQFEGDRDEDPRPNMEMVADLAVDGIHILSNYGLASDGIPSQVSRRDLPVSALHATILDMAARLARLRSVGPLATCHEPPAESTVSAHPRLLDAACWNLLDNAFRYSLAGCEVAVSLKVEPPSHLVLRTVNATFPQPSFDAAASTELGWRSEESRQVRFGNGYGLWIVDQVAKLHDGRLAARLIDGQTFVSELTLPLVAHEPSH